MWGDTTGTSSRGIQPTSGNGSLLGWAMSSLTLSKPSEQTPLAPADSSAPLMSSVSSVSLGKDSSGTMPVNVSSSEYRADQPAPVSPTSTDGWGEPENGLSEAIESDKDGWDDITPLEEPKPSPALANIQAAQKRPIAEPKPQATSLRPKNYAKAMKDEDEYLWGSIAAPSPKSASKPLNLKKSGTVEDDGDPWAATAAPSPTTRAKPLFIAKHI